jgi:hypothetical protein
MKAEMIETVRFFRRFRRDYIASTIRLLTAKESDSCSEELIQKIASDSYRARGLEGKMSKLVSQKRKKHARCVLNAQVTCKCREESHEHEIFNGK